MRKEYKQLSPKARENYDRKNAEFQQIKEYYNKCDNYSKTAKKFKIDSRTVKKYVHMARWPINKRKSSSKLDKFKKIIIDNIDKSEKKIFATLQKNGYKGYSNLRAYIRSKHLKTSTIDMNRYVNRTNIIDILHHKSIRDLGLKKDEEELLKKLIKQDKMLSIIIESGLLKQKN